MSKSNTFIGRCRSVILKRSTRTSLGSRLWSGRWRILIFILNHEVKYVAALEPEKGDVLSSFQCLHRWNQHVFFKVDPLKALLVSKLRPQRELGLALGSAVSA
jgi:hypothetical protein